MKLTEAIEKCYTSGCFRRPSWAGNSWLEVNKEKILFKSTGARWTPQTVDLVAEDYEIQVSDEMWEVWYEDTDGKYKIHPHLLTTEQKDYMKNVVITKKHIITKKS